MVVRVVATAHVDVFVTGAMHSHLYCPPRCMSELTRRSLSHEVTRPLVFLASVDIACTWNGTCIDALLCPSLSNHRAPLRAPDFALFVKSSHVLVHQIHVVRHASEALARRLQLKLHKDLPIVKHVCLAD